MKKLVIVIISLTFLAFVVIFMTFETAPLVQNRVFLNEVIHEVQHFEDPREAVEYLNDEISMYMEDMLNAQQEQNDQLQLFNFAFITVLGIIGVLGVAHVHFKILAPFKKLENFAAGVAAGNLDLPIVMDEGNVFGAFTESFDLMREQLKEARMKERLANLSKKELVASLSHDIKTPVASISTAIELLMLRTEEPQDLTRLKGMLGKCHQIANLVTDMFHATLEELEVLKVEPVEVISSEIRPLIEQADFEGKVEKFYLPECLIFVDVMRLQQVFDNIISNAYKYANTSLIVSAILEEDDLVVQIRDFGKGVADDDLLLIFNKFHRGETVNDVVGYGLGLYLSKHFIDAMGGSISASNLDDGFMVEVRLKLV